MKKTMKSLFAALTLSVGLSALPVDLLNKNQLIGDRISIAVEPQSQFLSSSAVDTVTGNYFLLWTRSGFRAYGRLLGPKGGKIAPLLSFKGETMPEPRQDVAHYAVYNSVEKRYFVTWHSSYGDLRQAPVAMEKRGQFVSSEGRAEGASWVITKEMPYWRKMLHNSRNNRYVLFYSIVPDGDETQRKLYLQRLDAHGRLFGKARKLNPPPGDLAAAADVAYDPTTNQYIVVWGPNSIFPGLVKYRTVSADLQTLGPVHAVEEKTSTYSNPVVNYDPYKKRFVLLWHSGKLLKMRGITSNGTPQTDVASLEIDNLISNYFTAEVNTSTGSILIGYLVAPGGITCLELMRLNNKFLSMGDPFFGSSQLNGRIHCSDIHLHYNPLVEEFMLIWSYLDGFPNSLDIYGQRIRGVPLTATQRQ